MLYSSSSFFSHATPVFQFKFQDSIKGFSSVQRDRGRTGSSSSSSSSSVTRGAPVVAPVVAPVLAPVLAPVVAPVLAPVGAPVGAPVVPIGSRTLVTGVLPDFPGTTGIPGTTYSSGVSPTPLPRPSCAPWAHPGHTLDAPRTHPGRTLDAPWTHPGRTLDAPRTHPGRTLDALNPPRVI